MSVVAVRGTTPIPNTVEPNGGGFPLILAYPVFLPSETTSIRLRFRNKSWDGSFDGTAASIDVALYDSDGSGNPTGTALATWFSQPVPIDGSDLVLSTVGITLGFDQKKIVVYSFPNGTNAIYSGFNNVGFYQPGASTVTPAPAPGPANPNVIYQMTYDYDFNGEPLIVVGDSISVGCTTIAPCGLENSAWYQLGKTLDLSVSQYGLPGGQLQQFALPGTYPRLHDEQKYSGAAVWIQAGVNDLAGGDPVAMENAMTTLVAYLRTRGVTRIFANTIAPQSAYVADSARIAYNAWLRANVTTLGLAGLADFALPRSQGGLAKETDPTVLDPPLSDDGTHWNADGHLVALDLMLTVYTEPTSVDTAEAIAVNTVRVTFTGGAVLAQSAVGVGDALNPASWVVSRVDTGAVFDVMSISAADDSGLVFDVVIYERFPGSLVQLEVDASAVLQAGGGTLSTPTTATFAGVVADALATPNALTASRRFVASDIANPPAPSRQFNTGGGTRVITSAGDFANESGNTLLKKLIYRRITTAVGGFFHLPGYGVGVNPKEPIRASDITALRTRIRDQIALEPEVVAVTVAITIQPAKGVVIIEAKVRTNTGDAFTVSVTHQQPN